MADASSPTPHAHTPPGVIRLLVLDVDGVLTDGRVRLTAEGKELKVFSARDGLGIRLWLDSGRRLAFITGRSSPAVEARARELGVKHVLSGIRDKDTAMTALLHELNISRAQTAAMGDDLPDLPMMRLAGFACAPSDAAAEVRAAAHLVTAAGGGHGAVREVIEHLLRAANAWETAIAPFTAGQGRSEGEEDQGDLPISG